MTRALFQSNSTRGWIYPFLHNNGLWKQRLAGKQLMVLAPLENPVGRGKPNQGSGEGTVCGLTRFKC